MPLPHEPALGPLNYPAGWRNPPGAKGVRRVPAKIAEGSLLPLATLTRRHDRRRFRRITSRLALIILAVVDIAIGRSVTIIIGPDCAGEAADRCADNGTGDRAQPADYCTGSGAHCAADQGTCRDTAKRRIIALGRSTIILAILNIAIGVAVVVVVGPY